MEKHLVTLAIEPDALSRAEDPEAYVCCERRHGIVIAPDKIGMAVDERPATRKILLPLPHPVSVRVDPGNIERGVGKGGAKLDRTVRVEVPRRLLLAGRGLLKRVILEKGLAVRGVIEH